MKDWQRIRLARTDLTDYVVHFTKGRRIFSGECSFPGRPGFANADTILLEILSDGHIQPTFAPIKSKTLGSTSNTVRGPWPAVCLTEQPLSAVLTTMRSAGSRYSGFGVAYHKYALYSHGGRPVFYGTKDMMGRKLKMDEDGFQEGRDIYTDGIPTWLQYLWVQYKPTVAHFSDYPIDFTWEREWRYVCRDKPLPIVLEQHQGIFTKELPVGALIVERDSNVDAVRECLAAKTQQGFRWPAALNRIVSLETAERMLKAGDDRYARIETWPE
ncbi:MAG: abortive infection system antitoxin AbiGi family protein [Pirellulales bacterium]